LLCGRRLAGDHECQTLMGDKPLVDKRVWNLKIRGKIALGYFLILLMLGAFLLIVSLRISKLEQETVFLSDHDMKVHELTYQIEKNVLDMETGQRGYALTGEIDYLPPYNNGLAEWRVNYAKLSGLIADNPSQVENLQTIRQNIELWIKDAGQYVVDLKRSVNCDPICGEFKKKHPIDLTRKEMTSEFVRSHLF
jgi:two-component system chemotaxis sensor kinase CheA